jgi:uncharacterized protein YjbI with pentapeptide repeats
MLLLKWLKRKRLISWRSLTVVGVVAVVIVVVKISEPVLWPGGVGLSKGESVATKTVESVGKNAQGQITKTVETTKIDDGKTLWDWLSLLGVPLSLAILGYWLQQAQQKRAEKLAEEQRELAADETKEEVLQVYFDRLSVLLVDKNLLAIAAKVHATETQGTESQPQIRATAEDRELLDSAVDVIRARTLSILRRFENDSERKTSVIRFLIEADIVSKLKLNLSGANLSGADLSRTDLRDANLSGANLSGADLSGTDLRDANLSRADLRDANLRGTNLSGADIGFAFLIGADFCSATLSGTDLTHSFLIGAKLNGAHLRCAYLEGVDLSGADLSGAYFGDTDISLTRGLTEEQLEGAKLCRTLLPDGIYSQRDCA